MALGRTVLNDVSFSLREEEPPPCTCLGWNKTKQFFIVYIWFVLCVFSLNRLHHDKSYS